MITRHRAEAVDSQLYERGRLVAHTSDDGGIPDVGLSVGLGDGKMLYAGERPSRLGWCLCIYSQTGTVGIAEGLASGPCSPAAELVEHLAAAFNR